MSLDFDFVFGFRYGEIFKTQILGYPCVMLTSPEAARFVLVTEADLFKPTYPRSKEILIGPNALFFHQGEYHTRLRKLVQGSLYPDAIRNLVPGIESIITTALDSWSDGRVINTFQEMKKVHTIFFFFNYIVSSCPNSLIYIYIYIIICSVLLKWAFLQFSATWILIERKN